MPVRAEVAPVQGRFGNWVTCSTCVLYCTAGSGGDLQGIDEAGLQLCGARHCSEGGQNCSLQHAGLYYTPLATALSSHLQAAATFLPAHIIINMPEKSDKPQCTNIITFDERVALTKECI